MKFIMNRVFWFGFSVILSILSVAAIATWGLRIGIDFKGGQLLEARFTEPTTIQEVRELIASTPDVPGATVATSSENSFLIRLAADEPDQIEVLRHALTEKIGEWQEIRFESVGPTVGRDLTRKAILGVALASLAIILYIAWAFRRVPAPTSSWQFGITAIIALLHDLLIATGAFALFGHLYGFEVDSLFITALLTVMGFSIHDTIVVYDRIRENLIDHPGVQFESVVTHSIQQTIVRSLNTSLTLIIVLIALLLLGGSTIRPFISALLVGVACGTYSSIFLASQLLVVWQRYAPKRS